MMRRTVIPLVLAVVAFALFMPVVCAGSSDDPTLGCDTFWGWTPGSATDGPEALLYLIPTALAIVVFVSARMLLVRRRGRSDPATSRS